MTKVTLVEDVTMWGALIGRPSLMKSPPMKETLLPIRRMTATFGTHLAVAGVHPRVAQQAMRHCRLELTSQFYTDPILLDVAGAVNALPDFSGGKSQAARQRFASVGA